MVYALGASVLAAAWMDLALSCREVLTEPKSPLGTAATVLALDHQELSTAAQLLLGEPSRGFLGLQGPPLGGANEWALEPFAPRVGEVLCPVVSRRLCDPTEGVADRASRSLNRQMLQRLRTCQTVGAWWVQELDPYRWL